MQIANKGFIIERSVLWVADDLHECSVFQGKAFWRNRYEEMANVTRRMILAFIGLVCATIQCAILAAEPRSADAPALADENTLKDRASQIILFPPMVEFLSMGGNEPIDVPRADRDELSKRIAQSFIDRLADKRVRATAVDRLTIKSVAKEVSPEDLFAIIRRGGDQKEAYEIQRFLAERYPQADLLIIRTRFYLNSLAQWGRGSQLAIMLWDAVPSHKRMVMDARLFSRDDQRELWRAVSQERVSPRASKKGIERAVGTLVDQFYSRFGRIGEANE